MELQLFVAVAMATTLAVYARPDGAPLSACRSLTPGHGTAQTGAHNIVIDSDVSSYKSGAHVLVTILGTFQGVLLQARRVTGSPDPVGTFEGPSPGLRLSSCDDIEGSAITHANSNNKTNGATLWNPPSTDIGDIQFIATVAKEKLMWWANITSITLTSDPSNPTSAPDTSTEATTTKTSPNAGRNLQGSGGSVWFYLMVVSLIVVYVIGL